LFFDEPAKALYFVCAFCACQSCDKGREQAIGRHVLHGLFLAQPVPSEVET
jgi:hypothetical protein